MQIVLIMLYKYQKYIMDNIYNLKRFNNNDITVITDNEFIPYFKDFLNLKIINVDDISNDYRNIINNLTSNYYTTFSKLTSYRFQILYEYMNKFNVESIIHIENDVLIYENMNNIHLHDYNKILLTMDSKNRCIPGIMYIPDKEKLLKCLDVFNNNIELNDMENWSKCYYIYNSFIDTFPIIFNNNYIHYNSNLNSNIFDIHTLNMINKNYNLYNCIFDAAAIGQYLGGISPLNSTENTVGFINETCIIDYSYYEIIWIKNKEGYSIPFLHINDTNIPIINLHIHSKELHKFIY